MKFRILYFLLSVLYCSPAFASDGYHIKIHFRDVKDSLVYLAHYYGKSTEAYRIDSSKINSSGNVEFKSAAPIVGGIYLLLFKDKTGTTEFILKNGDRLELDLSKKEGYATITCKGSEENTLYYEYQKYLVNYGKEYKQEEAKLKTCTKRTDSDAVIQVLNTKFNTLQTYRRGLAKKNPQLFLSKLFSSLEEPVVPKETPTLPNGKKDSNFSKTYYKQHFWDSFDFNDDRIIYTPVYESKLEHFFTRIVYPVPDSVNVEMDKILNKSKASANMFKYTLGYLSRWTEKNPVMGLDESYIYLVENYYIPGKATWIDSVQLRQHIQRAAVMAPCLLNQKIPNVTVSDSSNTQRFSLYGLKSNYTILVFWSPSCNHCQKDLPLFDSLLKTRFKGYDMQIMAVITSTDEVKEWKQFIQKHKLQEGWVHGYDPGHQINFKTNYDVYTTPTLYLLDREKRIIGKRLDAKNLASFLDAYETKGRDTVSPIKK
jgi:peroxiredoxin